MPLFISFLQESLRNQRIAEKPSDKLKKKHSEIQKGVKKSSAHKKNISKTLSNTTKSKEHAAAISAAMKGNSNASKWQKVQINFY